MEEGMAMHSSILAWRFPWTVEPGGLQCMRLQSQTEPEHACLINIPKTPLRSLSVKDNYESSSHEHTCHVIFPIKSVISVIYLFMNF